MNTETFFQQFELLADAPNGIQKLRELILQLAVQGKLVPQNPYDEPAAVLLEGIKAEKERLVKEGKIKKSKKLLEVNQDEIPLKLPDSWQWTRLGSISQIIGGGTPKTSNLEYYSNNDIAWLTPADLYKFKSKYIARGRRDISQLGLQKSSARLLPKGSVVFSSRAPIGYVAMASNELATNQGFKSSVPFVMEMNEYIYYFLKCAANEINRQASGTTFKEVSGKEVSLIKMPLPPLAEQKRIVEKVDRLMELCDRLETQKQQQQTKTLQLGTIATSRLTAAKTPEAFKQHWQNISNNFDLIYSTPENIKQLRQTILQLAVMGKLVPQNPDDEPASVLLAKIKAEKEKLIKEGKIKKSKKLKAIASDEIPFKLPKNWKWVKFDSIILEITSGWSPMCEKYPKEDGQWGVMKVSAVSWGKFNPNEKKALPSHFEPRTQFEAQVGDFLMSRANTSELVGKSVIVDNTPKKLLLSDKILKVSFSSHVHQAFFNFVNNSLIARNHYAQVSSGTSTSMRNISRIQILSMPIPIPPTSEQHRIVAKVNQLMTYCDELEAKLTQSLSDKEKLMDTAVYQLLTA